MKDEKISTPQPELYKCNYCENYSTTRYDLAIQVDFDDEAIRDDIGWREYPVRLCRHCYFNWYEGRMSTQELLWGCDHNERSRHNVQPDDARGMKVCGN